MILPSKRVSLGYRHFLTLILYWTQNQLYEQNLLLCLYGHLHERLPQIEIN